MTVIEPSKNAGYSATQWIAVLGGATVYDERQVEAAYVIGERLAIRGFGLVTGATTGLPFAAALGAKAGGGLVVGVSPAASWEEHVRDGGRPLDAHDFIVFTGLGAEGRAPLILRSVAAAVFIGGEMGTLNEFAVGWMLGIPLLGVLSGYGGIAEEFEALARRVRSSWGSEVVVEGDPATLAETLARRVGATVAHLVSAEEERVRRLLANRRTHTTKD